MCAPSAETGLPPPPITSDWRERFDLAFPISIDYPPPPHANETGVFTQIEIDARHKRALSKHEAVKAFIEKLLERAREEGPKSIEADFEAGRADERASLREMILKLQHDRPITEPGAHLYDAALTALSKSILWHAEANNRAREAVGRLRTR
jgi:hypothetical protein